jgi:hypothetical protein
MGSMGGGGQPKVEESPLEADLAEISREKWDRYKEAFRPVEAKYRERITDFGTKAAGDRAAGMATVELSSQYGKHVSDAVSSETIKSGVRPGSGRRIGMRSNMNRMGAKLKSGAATDARSGQKDRYFAGMQNALNIGQGQAVTAQNSMEDLVGNAVSKQRDNAVAKWNGDSAVQSMAVQGAGLGASYFKNKET